MSALPFVPPQFPLSRPTRACARWTCRKSSPPRGRAAKRSRLYDAMSAYAAHFRPLLSAELAAEQDASLAHPHLAPVRDLVATRHSRVFSSLVFALRPAPRQRFRRADLLSVSDGTVSADVSVMCPVRLLVAAPVGSPSARALNEFAHSGARLCAVAGANTLPYERAVAALDALTAPGPRSSDMARLLVLSFAESQAPSYSAQPREFACLQPGGPWHDLACETVSRIARENLNRVVKALPLNVSQRRAVSRALQARLTLIQGPPGTGKTLVAAHLVAACVKLRLGPVLACAASNVATDNLLRKILAAVPKARVVRLGRASAVGEDLWPVCLEAMLERNREVRTAREALERGDIRTGELAEIESRAASAVLKRADVVVGTCVSCGRDELSTLTFPVVVVDEATQATEPDVLIPLSTTPEMARQLVLVGDHHQLPPTVLSQDQDRGLESSLFLRLWSSGVGCELLRMQYRMHPHISCFPAQHFYFGRLQDGVTASDRQLSSAFEMSMFLGPKRARAVFCNVRDGFEESDLSLYDAGARGTSFLNKSEAATVLTLCNLLISYCGTENDKGTTAGGKIGVISPYAAQVRLLNDIMQGLDEPVEVSTVDSFQGREKDIIIISSVRSNEEAHVGFLRDWRRLNVAITRARHLLIVVGNRNTLRADYHWELWLRWVTKNGTIFEADQLCENIEAGKLS